MMLKAIKGENRALLQAAILHPQKPDLAIHGKSFEVTLHTPLNPHRVKFCGSC